MFVHLFVQYSPSLTTHLGSGGSPWRWIPGSLSLPVFVKHLLLQPLPVPQQPWSHISLDFVTRLPPSDDSNVNLTVVYGFPRLLASFY